MMKPELEFDPAGRADMESAPTERQQNVHVEHFLEMPGGRLALIRPCGATFSLRAKSRLRRLRRA